MGRTVLFLDIDEVLSNPDCVGGIDRLEIWQGLPAFPVPLSYPLIRAFAQDRRLYPVWMTCWGTAAPLWNGHAGTPPFPVTYPLSPWKRTRARHLFPDTTGINRSGKLLAARYFLRHYPDRQVIWLEDGFDTATRNWAAQNGLVRLVNSYDEPFRSLLLSEHRDICSATRVFVEHLLSWVPV